ncbi:hypothetical protein DM02DRAFT_587373 [Periconia macrospinosa]|uniref:ABM domain-containing protein n=1 Tax=Periconia macrospinosa TaxID=97972 RepID=A0A2V1E0T4_9PLEO|nr:hypothetical protein DM02DRAFT_587373 [Periconia macrospinosa]
MPIDVIAILSPKPGKADRVEELLKDVSVSVKANEPGTLKYQINRETKGDAPSIVMIETYKDQAALQAHGSSDYFKKMGLVFQKEDLLAGPMKLLFTKETGGFVSKI